MVLHGWGGNVAYPVESGRGGEQEPLSVLGREMKLTVRVKSCNENVMQGAGWCVVSLEVWCICGCQSFVEALV